MDGIRNNFIYLPWNCGYKLGQDIPPSIGYKDVSNPNVTDFENAIILKELLGHLRDNDPTTLFRMGYVQFMMSCEILDIPGELIEKYFCYYYPKIHAKEAKGDRIDPETNKTFQFKSSILTSAKREVNINHIQKWQEADEYRIVIIDRTNFYKPYFFILTRDQMMIETKKLGCHPMDGTKSSNSHNRRHQLKSILVCKNGQENFQRWMQNYNSKFWCGAWGGEFSP